MRNLKLSRLVVLLAAYTYAAKPAPEQAMVQVWFSGDRRFEYI